jgi:ribosomal protein S18 acetylase RimI-like enzyme
MTTALVRTRLATDRDVAAVHDLYNRCSWQTRESRFHVPVHRVSRRLVEQLVLPPHGWSIVAEQGHELVGHACAGPLSPTAVEVALLVDDAMQGTGIGTRLLRELASEAADRGFDSVVCSVEPHNEAMPATVRRAGLTGTSSYVDGVLEIVVPLDTATCAERRPA